MFFEIGIFGKFLELTTLQIFGILQIGHFSNFPNWKIKKF